ncbi:unnamed protein product [Mytilus coruscus]|uniref:Uncharacterized protein n=1 Tax=Mytilus coruscus TaxID=42192 RepID=A0A6J8ASX5_MYTCO|nr:unnamed protein product [Mytilus coruscus]
MSDKANVASIDTNAIYHEVSPNIILLLRFFNFLTFIMAVISFILCIVQGDGNETYYLLACNTVISCLVGIVVNWWYRSGDLGPEKFWYIFLVGAVIMFQCITTDIFVFHVLNEDSKNINPPSIVNKTTIFPAISVKPASTVKTLFDFADRH